MNSNIFSMRSLIVLVAGFLATFIVSETEAQQLPFTIDKGWTIPLIGKYSRSAVVQDELLFRLINQSFRSPQDADTLIAPDGVVYHWKRENAENVIFLRSLVLTGKIRNACRKALKIGRTMFDQDSICDLPMAA
jgi:hypothetical protein